MKNFNLLSLGVLVLALVLIGCDPEEVTPDPVAAFSVSDASVLQVGEEITFVNESTNAVTFNWSFGDGEVFTGQNATHTYTEAGTYTVTLEASAEGLRSTATQEVTIGERPNPYALVYIDNTDGLLRQLTLADSSVTDLFALPGFCMGVEYDAANGYVYYTDDDNLKVLRNTLDGQNEVEIVTDLAGPRDLALDATNNVLYVVDRSADAVLSVDLGNGNAVDTVFSSSDNAQFLLPVGIDLHDGVLYVTAVDFDAESVWTANTDGTGLTKIIDYNAGGFGYGIAVDGVNETIYFDDNDGGNIRSAGLDGSGVGTVAAASDRAYGIAVENTNGRLYWATRDGVIRGANLDGSEAGEVLTTGNDYRGMVLIDTSN